MDSVTHTLIGVGMANAFFRRRIGPSSVVILAVASNLPDIDAVAHLIGDSTSILARRTFGHSLFLVPLWSLILAFFFQWFYPKIRWRTLFGLVLLGASVHLFFDLVNSFGVVLLWPFSTWRPELGIIFIIDLILTGILLFPLLVCIPKRIRPLLGKLSRVSMALVVLYVLVCGASRLMAHEVLTADATNAAGKPHDFVYLFPEPLGPHRWKGVVRDGDTYRVYLIHTLPGRMELKKTIRTEPADPDVERVRHTDLGRRLEWFFKAPVWSVLPPKENPGNGSKEIEVYDLRFRSMVITRESPFTYRFLVYPDGRVEFEKGRG